MNLRWKSKQDANSEIPLVPTDKLLKEQVSLVFQYNSEGESTSIIILQKNTVLPAHNSNLKAVRSHYCWQMEIFSDVFQGETMRAKLSVKTTKSDNL